MKMMITTILGLLPCWAQAVELDHAAELGVNQKGWDEVAAWVEAEQLPDINAMPLDDVDDTLDNGVEMKAEGLRVWAKFQGVRVTPAPGKLQVEVGIRDVHMQADSLRIRKKIWGNYVSTTCRDMDVYVAEGRALPMRLEVTPRVQNRRFRLGSGRAEFSIPENEYRVSGPDRCSGALGVGNLIASIVKSILKDSREDIERVVRDELEGSVPDLERKIQASLSQPFAFEIEERAPFQGRSAVARTYPTNVRMTASSGRFELGVRIEEVTPLGEEVLKDFRKTGAIRLGFLGMNPKIVTEVFASLYPDGTDWYELTEDEVPGLKEVVSTQAASGIWPDLDYQNLTHDRLKLFVRIVDTPLFETNERGNRIRANFPRMMFHFEAEIDGAWTPYFDLEVALDGAVKVSASRGAVQVSLAEDYQLEVGGDWADGYAPMVDLVEYDVASFLLSTVLDYLYASGPITEVKFPEIDLGRSPLQLREPSIAQHYLRLELYR